MSDPSKRAEIDAHLHLPFGLPPEEAGCAWPGCARSGNYRAPASRTELRRYLLFCLDHVRDYNRQWDFFAGMDTASIDAHRRADATWHRPSWPFGAGSARDDFAFIDPYEFLGDGPRRPAAAQHPCPRARRMMQLLELNPGFTLAELKQRYKILVKLHHPDVNGGDKAAEERLKLIIEAYRYLIDHDVYA